MDVVGNLIHQNHDQGQSKWLTRQSTTNSVLWRSHSVQKSGQIWPIDLMATGVIAYQHNVYGRVDPVSSQLLHENRTFPTTTRKKNFSQLLQEKELFPTALVYS